MVHRRMRVCCHPTHVVPRTHTFTHTFTLNLHTHTHTHRYHVTGEIFAEVWNDGACVKSTKVGGRKGGGVHLSRAECKVGVAPHTTLLPHHA